MGKQPTDLDLLRKEWYKKLADDGFEDIENLDETLKLSSDRYTRKKFLKSYKEKAEYYYMANHFLNTHEFQDSLEQLIWEYHVNGIGVRAIANELLRTKVLQRTNRTTIWIIIRDLRKIMHAMYRST